VQALLRLVDGYNPIRQRCWGVTGSAIDPVCRSQATGSVCCQIAGMPDPPEPGKSGVQHKWLLIVLVREHDPARQREREPAHVEIDVTHHCPQAAGAEEPARSAGHFPMARAMKHVVLTGQATSCMVSTSTSPLVALSVSVFVLARPPEQDASGP